MRSLWMYISLVVIFIAVSVPSVSAKPYPVRPRADPPSPSKAASSSDITANENTSTAGPRDETPPTTDLPTSSRSAAAAARTSDHHTETDTQKSSSPTSVKTTSTPAIPSGSAAVGTAKPSGNENSTAPTNGEDGHQPPRAVYADSRRYHQWRSRRAPHSSHDYACVVGRWCIPDPLRRLLSTHRNQDKMVTRVSWSGCALG